MRVAVRRELHGPLEVECEQRSQEIVIAHVGVPAVGGEDPFVEFAVGQIEPGGTFVVEIGQRPLFELLRTLFVLGHQPRVLHGADVPVDRVGVDVAFPGSVGGAGEFEHLGPHPLRRIEPRLPQLIQFRRRCLRIGGA